MTVDEQDALVAEELVRFCLYKEVPLKGSKLKKKRGAIQKQMKGLNIVDDEDQENEPDQDQDQDDEQDLAQLVSHTLQDEPAASTSMDEHFTPEMVSMVRSNLLKLRSKNASDNFLPLSMLMEELGGESVLSIPKVEAILHQMEQANMLMYRDQTIIFL
jgi:hypothetical protein